MSAKSPVIVDLKFIPREVEDALKGAFPGREVLNLADPRHKGRDLSGIDYAVVWKSDPDLFSRAPDLKVVFSGGAGVDHVLTLPGLPDVPLVRFVDRSLTTRMSEWVVMNCLMHLRQHRAYEARAKAHVWEDLSQPEAADVTVGVMGLGVLGLDAIRKLGVMGFKTIGWSRSKKTIDGVQTFDGDELDAFLAKTDFLVSLLPLTAETKGYPECIAVCQAQPQRAFGSAGRDQWRPRRQSGRRRYYRRPAIRRAGRRFARCVRAGTVGSRQPVLGYGKRLCHAARGGILGCEGAVCPCGAAQMDRFESGLPLEHLVDRKAGY